jgi:hypothetical protein
MTQDWPQDAIFTIGHSTLPIADFIGLLETYGIGCLTDVPLRIDLKHFMIDLYIFCTF